MDQEKQLDAHHLEVQRRDNREAIRDLGIAPYGRRTDDIVELERAKSAYDAAADEAHQQSASARKQAKKDAPENAAADLPELVDDRPRVRVAGRVVLKRDGGKLIWLNLRDHTGDLQVAVSKRDVEDPGFRVAELLDLGDVVIAEGPLMKTRTGEVTVWASGLTLGAKSLSPPPEKWSGLQDVEQRYRKRYVDLYANPDAMRVAMLRAQIVSRIRAFLHELSYIEVETPILQAQAGGAAARPFVTHMHALDIDLFLRIAPELYLKRLMVGGMPRVYEINRNFRNEGLDKQHNPEFTMIELYHAFGNVETVMDVTESMIRDAGQFVASVSGAPLDAMPFAEYTVDYQAPFARVRYADLFERALGFPMFDTDRVRTEADTRGITDKVTKKLAGEGRTQDIDPIILVNELFEDVAEQSLEPGVPTFITHYPAALSPLTRPNEDDPMFADRADLFIGHMEIGPHYTELNDPDVQEAKFREQLSGIDDEESTFRTFDADFINALKVGMPPAGGMGVGIDRLCMLLLNQRTIRDVVLFPMMRPEV